MDELIDELEKGWADWVQPGKLITVKKCIKCECVVIEEVYHEEV